MRTRAIICDRCGRTVQVGKGAYYDVKPHRHPAPNNPMFKAVHRWQLCEQCVKEAFRTV